MPKITAESIGEHVARQEAAVVSAAIRLFSERGVAAVSLGDIAKEVGLARNSIYRYFPDTAHILGAWFRATVEPLIERSDAIADDDRATVRTRLDRWVLAQFDYLVDPAHSVMLELSNQLSSMPPDVRAELGAGHQRLYQSLERLLGQSSVPRTGRSIGLVTMFVAALIRGAAEQVRSGAAEADVRAELSRSAWAIVALPADAEGR